MFVEEIFKALIDKYCSHIVYTDVNTCMYEHLRNIGCFILWKKV
jgi:hypothetical protein